MRAWLRSSICAGESRAVLVVHRWRVGDADDRALERLEPRHRLDPRFLACRMQQLMARLLQLLRRRVYRRRVCDVELDADLGHRPIGWPLGAPEARFRRLGQRPDTKVLAAGDLVGVVVLVITAA